MKTGIRSREGLLAWREATIDKHGWAAIHVGPTRDDPGSPFTYSVGFETTFRCPEVVVVGFDSQTAHVVLSGIAGGMKRGDLDWAGGSTRLSGVIQEFDIGLRPVPDVLVSSIARAAADRAAPGRVRLVQALVPDPQGLLPGEPGCWSNYETLQDIQAI